MLWWCRHYISVPKLSNIEENLGPASNLTALAHLWYFQPFLSQVHGFCSISLALFRIPVLPIWAETYIKREQHDEQMHQHWKLRGGLWKLAGIRTSGTNCFPRKVIAVGSLTNFVMGCQRVPNLVQLPARQEGSDAAIHTSCGTGHVTRSILLVNSLGKSLYNKVSPFLAD